MAGSTKALELLVWLHLAATLEVPRRPTSSPKHNSDIHGCYQGRKQQAHKSTNKNQGDFKQANSHLFPTAFSFSLYAYSL